MDQKRHVRTFYVMLLTQTVSLLGSRMSAFAIGIWVFKQTGNATPLALVAFSETIPMIILGNIAGLFIDRWDRRFMMALAGTGQAFGSLLLLFSFLSGNFQLWHLYVVTLIQSIFGIFHQLAFEASVTMLVPDSQRDRANAIRQFVGPLAGTLAPAITSGLYVLLNVTGVIAIDLLTFLVAVAVVMVVNIPRPQQSAEGRAMRASFWREITGGFKALWARRPLFIIMMFASLINFAFAAALILSTPYILARLDSKWLTPSVFWVKILSTPSILARPNAEAELGIILSVMNLGAILGGIVMGVWGGTRPRIHTVLVGVLISGFALAAYGTSRNPWLIGLALFGVMFPLPFVNAAMMSIFQIKIPPDLQGRTMAVINQVAAFLSPLAYLMVGPLVDKTFEPAVNHPGWETVASLVGNQSGAGMGLIMVISGTIVVSTTLIVYLIPSIRHMEATLPDYNPTAQIEAVPVEVPEFATV